MIGIEFHDWHKASDPEFALLLSGLFAKLFRQFVIVHAHPNNNAKNHIALGEIYIPDVVELTFLRRDRLAHVERQGEDFSLPNKYDFANNQNKRDLTLPKEWWPVALTQKASKQ